MASWRDFRWQVIHQHLANPGWHVALDQVLLDEVAAGVRPPLLRFWEWDGKCAVLGRFQSLANEIHPRGTQQQEVTLLRRISGGGTMYMNAPHCITYSICVPESLVEGMPFRESYAFLDRWVVDALNRLGIEAWYKPINDITSPRGKIAGAAQLRRRGTVLHHTTLAYDMDQAAIKAVLRTGLERLSEKGIASAVKAVDPLRRQTDLPREAVIAALIDSFSQQCELTESQLTTEEIAAAKKLFTDKLGTREWLERVP